MSSLTQNMGGDAACFPKRRKMARLGTTNDINKEDSWEEYFKDGWEKNNGRSQTRLFAHYFLKNVSLPSEARSLLDVGCAMGDALPEFHEAYPQLKLTGCDFSEIAIGHARSAYGDFAEFKVSAFDQID